MEWVLIFSKLAYAMIKNGKYNYVSQLILIVGFQNLVRVLIFIKLSLCYDNKWKIKLGISVNIYCRLPKLAITTHVFKISLCYDEKWEIKLQTTFSSSYAGRCSHGFPTSSEVCACFGLGNVCERLCVSRPLLRSYVHQESI